MVWWRLLATMGVVVTLARLGVPRPAGTADQTLASFAQQVRGLVSQYADQGLTHVGIVIADSDHGAAVSINADETFPAASLYKLFVLWEVQRSIEAGLLTDDTIITLTEQTDDAEDDTEPLGQIGDQFSVAQLRDLMITESNNTASWMLAYTIGWDQIDANLREHGYAISQSLPPTVTTPNEIARFFTQLLDRTLDSTLTEHDYTLMLTLLKESKTNDFLSPGLPDGAVFAHKIGDLDNVTNDAGIIMPDNGQNIAIAVLTEGDREAALGLMYDVAQLTWDTLAAAPAPPTPPDAYTFPETGFTVSGKFLAYWQANGGLAQFGFPITAPFEQQLEDGNTYTVQYFERARFELHPENAPPHDVELGQFGRILHPADPAVAADPQAVQYFAETGHNVYSLFDVYWQEHGGLAQFGYPISEPFKQRLENGQTYTVQYFERARFEYHPNNAPPYDVLLGQFGRLILARQGR
ncbi:MAG: serine hydrolase [Thermomicrobiales bacterium]